MSVSCEFFYARGKTDVVALTDGEVLIAFEAKLKDQRCGQWKTDIGYLSRACISHYIVILTVYMNASIVV